jgi:uncharacterized protein YukE
MSSNIGNLDLKNSEQLKTLAGRIDQERNKLNTTMETINNTINALRNDGLNHATGENLRNRFNSLRQDYNNRYTPAFNSYIQYLNNTAGEYERLFQRIGQDIDANAATRVD